MTRIVKEEEFAEKHNAILDVAQRLIYTRSYNNRYGSSTSPRKQELSLTPLLLFCF